MKIDAMNVADKNIACVAEAERIGKVVSNATWNLDLSRSWM